jgi:branched-chain amino acid transport system permease protein
MTVLRKAGLGGITGSPQAFVICCLLLLVLLGIPLLHNGYYENLFRGILMFATMALGWNIIGGYTGYVSFGNVVFFGIGTYVSGFLSLHGVQNVWIAIPCAILAAAFFATILGIPILRLRGHYFGIATLGIALATQEIVANIEPLGGGQGITLQQAEWFGQYYYAMWGVCALSLIATWWIARSKLGYALVAIRENEDAAAALGINPTAHKVGAWEISATMPAAAGAVFAFSNGYIDPSVGFSVDYNVFPIVMVILGGLGTVAGPVVGAFLLTAVNETLWNHYPQVHTLFFGIAIVLVVLFLPRGLLYVVGRRSGWRGFLKSMSAYRV